MEDIYMLSDKLIQRKIGLRLKAIRLKQNITQQALADAAEISLSSVKKIEKGEIGSFDSLLRVHRILGQLDALQPMMEEEQLSPREYYELVQKASSHSRKRAAGSRHKISREG